VGTLAQSKERPDQYAAGFVQAGARTVIADVAQPHTAYIDWLFVKHISMAGLFTGYPTYHGHPIVTPSVRQPGFVTVLDPTTWSGPFYRSIVYHPRHTTDQVTRTVYRHTDVAPPALTAPGAAEATTPVAYFAESAAVTADGSGAPAGTLAAGTDIRLTGAQTPLADGTKVFAFTTLDGGTSGFVAAGGLAPRDSAAPQLWTLDRPYSPASADGTYPFAIGYRASEVVDARIEIRNAAGTVVKTASLRDDWTRWTWDLVADAGTTVPNGVYTWSLRGADAWGNAPFSASGDVTIDGTDPVSTAEVAGTVGNEGWYVSKPAVTIATTDTGSGVHARRYTIDGGPSKAVTGPITIGTSGDVVVRYWAVDRAGNVEGSRYKTLHIDLVKPVTTAAVTGPVGTNGWFTGPVSVALSAVEVHSGLSGIAAAVDGAPSVPYAVPIALTTEGAHTLTYRATDRAGNLETLRTTTVRIDGTAPTSTGATLAGTMGAEGWYTGPVTVTFAGGSDGLSGFLGYRWRVDGGGPAISTTGTAVVATSGDHVLTWGAQDRAGNVESWKTLTFRMDVDAPVTTATVDGPGTDPGFYRGPVSVTLSAADPHSGVAGVSASVDGATMAPVTGAIALDASGAHTITYRATDRAGNVEAARTLKLVIDRTAPDLGTVTVGGPFSPNGDGTRDSAAISHEITEPGTLVAVVKDGSGATIRSFTARVTGPGTIAWDGRTEAGSVVPDGSYTVTVTPRDRAGNPGAAVTVAVHVFGAFVGGAVSPALFYPQDGDAQAKAAILRATLKRATTVRLQVVDAKGATIRTITRSVDAGTFAFGWDGRTDGGAFAPQGRYTLRFTAGEGNLVETKRFVVVARAFDIRPSLTTALRGRALTVTVVSAEALHTSPRLVIRQPGIAAYRVALRLVGPRTWRATFTVKASRTGTMSLAVDAQDSEGHGQQTRVSLPIR
jgi:flagellar hook assembly protein FlgD